MHADELSPQPQDDGRAILTAIFDIMTELKRKAGDREDTATVFLLRHIQAAAPPRVSDLACSVHLDASTVSRHVKQLDDAGHLTRIEDPDDRRATRLAVTDQGRALLEAAMGVRADLLREGLTDWSDSDRAQLTALLTRLAGALRPATVPTALETR